MAVLMLFAFGAKEAHHFVHKKHTEVKICDARVGEHHFHDQDYIHDDCRLCDFTFSVYELTVAQFMGFQNLNDLIPQRTFFYPSFFSFKLSAFALLRGPPVVA